MMRSCASRSSSSAFRLIQALSRKRRTRWCIAAVVSPQEKRWCSTTSTSRTAAVTKPAGSSTNAGRAKHKLISPHLVAGQQRRLEATAVEVEEPAYESDLVVVLDMDECLIHSKFTSAFGVPSPAQRLAHQLAKDHDNDGDSDSNSLTPLETVDTFCLTLPDGDVVHVHERPFLHDFLRTVCRKYETHVFTAAMEIYAKPILDTLDPSGKLLAGRWYRDHCVRSNQAFVKDLTFLNKPPERIVLVDNNPLSFLANPNNGILVKSFYEDPNDTTLLGVLELLEELDPHEDVRPLLVQKFELEDALKELTLKT